MKNRLLFLPIAAIAISMTCCDLDDKEWLKEYGTPELFLSHVEGDYHLESLIIDGENCGDDNNFEIRNALLESGSFEKSEKHDISGTYFTYQAYWQPATTGPNICEMDIAANGNVRIHHKRSIGLHQYVYFTMDETKATSLNTLVREKVAREKQIAEEARAQALIDGTIDNFIAEMENKTQIDCAIVDDDNGYHYSYFFQDSGELLDLIKQATFTPSDKEGFYGYNKFTYNAETDWSLIVDSTDGPYIRYKYTDSVGRKETLCISYSIPEAELNAILTRAFEIGKATPQIY